MQNQMDELNRGEVTAIRGSVVDARFRDQLPPIHSLLRTGTEAEIAIEVLMQLDETHVRCIALNPTQGRARDGSDGHWWSFESTGR